MRNARGLRRHHLPGHPPGQGDDLDDLLEEHAPEGNRRAPRPGSTISDRTPKIVATVLDAETDLAKQGTMLRVDGRCKTGFAYDRSTERLDYTTGTLGYGRHTVEVRTRDAQRLEGSRTWSFRVSR